MRAHLHACEKKRNRVKRDQGNSGDFCLQNNVNLQRNVKQRKAYGNKRRKKNITEMSEITKIYEHTSKRNELAKIFIVHT